MIDGLVAPSGAGITTATIMAARRMVAAMAAETEGHGSADAPAMDPDVAAMMQAGPVSDPSMLTALIGAVGGLMILGFVVWVLTRQPAAHRLGDEQRQTHDGDGGGDGSD